MSHTSDWVFDGHRARRATSKPSASKAVCQSAWRNAKAFCVKAFGVKGRLSERVAERQSVLRQSRSARAFRATYSAQGIPYQYLDGATPPARRTAAVDAFQSGDGDVFLISLKAGGFGLNLTAADYGIHVDPWWNPAVAAQASDRAHCIGQTRPVTVYRLIASGTIEERIVELHQKKRELATSLLDDSHSTAALSPDELRVLLAPVPSGT